MPLAYSIALRDDGALRGLDRPAHVRLQLRTFHFTVAVNGINFPIVIEKYAKIIDTSLHVMVLPGTTDILRGIALKALAVDVGKHIELPVMVADGWCPDTLTVDLLVVLQRESIVVEIETVKAIADILPVHQVLGMEDNESRYGMHRSTGQIVVITHAQDIRIRKLVVEERISKGSVTIVSRP